MWKASSSKRKLCRARGRGEGVAFLRCVKFDNKQNTTSETIKEIAIGLGEKEAEGEREC